MDRASTIEMLEKKIMAANKAYWVHNDPKISDAEYDVMIEELRQLDPENELVSKVHDRFSGKAGKFNFGDRPMLSLGKVYSTDELVDWMKSVSRSPEEKFLLQPKYDGISGCFDPAAGVLATRGDGQVGEIINSKMAMIVPSHWNGGLTRSAFPKNGGQIRGEIILEKSTFAKLQQTLFKKDGQPYKNARNCVAGLCNPASSLQDDQENAVRMAAAGIAITFINHDEISTEIELGTDDAALAAEIQKVWNLYRSEIPFEQDGLVIKLADREYAESLGNTSHHPKGALALKEADDSAGKWTTLRGINWTLGQNGELTPTGVIDPVELDVTIVNVLLHHFQNVVEKELSIDGNTEIFTLRSGSVIPFAADTRRAAGLDLPVFVQIGLDYREASPEEIANSDIFVFDWNGKKYVLLCPSCHSALSYHDGDVDIKCLNLLCRGAVLKRIYNACSKCFEIDGLAESTLAKLFDQRGLRHFYELFDLQPSDFIGIEGFAEKSAEDLVDKIQLASSCTDVQILASLGIPMIGMNVSRDLLSEMPLEVLREASVATLTEIKGIGPEKARSLKEGLEKYSDELDQLLCRVSIHQTYSKSKAAQAKGIQTICFTGKAPYERSVLQELAKKNGYEPVSAVTKTLSVLVAASGDSQSTKAQKARKYGTRVLTFDEWFNSLENRDIEAQKDELASNGGNPLIDEIFG